MSRAARAWPPADASPCELNLHLGETWESVERSVGESDLIRSERKNQAPSLVEDLEAGPWRAGRLAMRARTAVSRIMREAREHLENNRKAKAPARRLEKQVSQI